MYFVVLFGKLFNLHVTINHSVLVYLGFLVQLSLYMTFKPQEIGTVLYLSVRTWTGKMTSWTS